MNPTLKPAFRLSVIATLLAAVASAGGLLLPGLYRDNEFIRNAWFGSDLVTLLLVLPAMVTSLLYARRGSTRAQLLWMGLLGYLFYNYAFYLFGAAFNRFFLLYVALFSIAMYGLILGLSRLDVPALASQFDGRAPIRTVSAYLLAIVAILGIFEVSQCVRFILFGTLPAAPSLIFALDLPFVVTTSALAAILLLKRRPWGYVLSSIMLVKGFTYGLALIIGTILAEKASGSDPLFPFYLAVAAGGLVGLVWLLSRLRPHQP